MDASPAARLARARLSLDGLSIGDAFGSVLGEFAAGPREARWLRERITPPGAPWATTDDTEMGIAVVETLKECQAIDPDKLAARFADRFRRDPARGYGGTARKILAALGQGGNWRTLAPAVFNGKGSMGNGAAMRAMPIGAFFADDPAQVVEQARRSALPTHANPEGEAGAIAAALGAAWAARRSKGLERGPVFEFVLASLRAGKVREVIERARDLAASQRARSQGALDISTIEAVQALGSGQQVVAQDTVPFCLWCVDRAPDDFAAALWRCADGAGDRDTTCAIVGGIVALSAGRASIPERWLASREPLRPT
jgi:ADP-ribosylglycohydrolase